MENDADAIELKELRAEVRGLGEEREEQSRLVAGIVHQRDLYRPAIEARNDEMSGEIAALRAGASSSKHEIEALEGRLARVDSHAAELTTSNDRLRGVLTAAKSALCS